MELILIKSFRFSLINVLLFIACTFTSSYAKEQNMVFAYLIENVNNLDKNNSNNLIKILLDEIFKNKELDFDVKIYNNYDNFFKDLKNNKINLFNISSFSYIKNKKELDPFLDSLWTISQNMNDNFNRFYLISNNNSVKSLKDLDNKKTALIKNTNWNKIFLKATNPKLNYIYAKNESAALLNTYFGKYDACVVSSYTYASMLELNPSLIKNITILKKSEKVFLKHLLVLPISNLKKDIDIMNKLIFDFSISKSKNDIFTLFEVTNINLLKKEEFTNLAKYYKKNSIYINVADEK